MLAGSVDIEMDDRALLDEMMMIKYKFSVKGSIQIESKDDMRSRGMKSPDRLDAAMYACLDMSALVGGRFGNAKPGDQFFADASEFSSGSSFLSDWVW